MNNIDTAVSIKEAAVLFDMYYILFPILYIANRYLTIIFRFVRIKSNYSLTR